MREKRKKRQIAIRERKQIPVLTPLIRYFFYLLWSDSD